MRKTVKLLLTENVDNLGIVGDVVSVRLGYARNFLLPRSMATTPSQEALAAVAEKRKAAEKMVAELRGQRKSLTEKLEGFELTIKRSCNDQGILYGAVTQQDIARALNEQDVVTLDIKARDVRLPQTIKRLDTYEIHLKFDSDLESTIKLWVVPDRDLAVEERQEMEFDNEGNLIHDPARDGPRKPAARRAEPAVEEGAEGATEPAPAAE